MLHQVTVRWRSSTLVTIGVWFVLELFPLSVLGLDRSEGAILLLRYARILLDLVIVVLLISEENFPVALLFGVFLLFGLSHVGSKVIIPVDRGSHAHGRSSEVATKKLNVATAIGLFSGPLEDLNSDEPDCEYITQAAQLELERAYPIDSEIKHDNEWEDFEVFARESPSPQVKARWACNLALSEAGRLHAFGPERRDDNYANQAYQRQDEQRQDEQKVSLSRNGATARYVIGNGVAVTWVSGKSTRYPEDEEEVWRISHFEGGAFSRH